MILTFVGNEKHLNNEEIKEIMEMPNLNRASNYLLGLELRNRTEW